MTTHRFGNGRVDHSLNLFVLVLGHGPQSLVLPVFVFLKEWAILDSNQ